jgi:hypothetical protein
VVLCVQVGCVHWRGMNGSLVVVVQVRVRWETEGFVWK